MNVTVEISDDSHCHRTPENRECESWIRQALEQAGADRACNVSLRFVDAAESQRLNTEYRGRRAAANVLSFPTDFPAAAIESLPFEPMGDIVICPDIVEREAQQQEKNLRAHWAHLVIHGVLHLLGYGHDDDAGAEIMEQLEIEALEKLGFPNPYLVG
jgi:probable rRNA maturation factor